MLARSQSAIPKFYSAPGAHGDSNRRGSTAPKGDHGGANQCKAGNVFWVPAEARRYHLQASAKQPTIGKTVDYAMVAIERDNPSLKGVLPKDYVLANPPFNDSDTALRDSAFIQSEAKPQVVREAKDNFRKDDDVRWLFGVRPKGNPNFAWVQPSSTTPRPWAWPASRSTPCATTTLRSPTCVKFTPAGRA